MAAQVLLPDGHDHHVGHPEGDVLVAARAHVGLAGLVGLDGPHLHLVPEAGRLGRGRWAHVAIIAERRPTLGVTGAR